MNNDEMRNFILFQLHKNIDYWYKLLGEFCDGSKYFSEAYEKQIKVDKTEYTVFWCPYSGWSVT